MPPYSIAIYIYIYIYRYCDDVLRGGVNYVSLSLVILVRPRPVTCVARKN